MFFLHCIVLYSTRDMCAWLRVLQTASEDTSDRRVGVSVQLGRYRRTVLGVRPRDRRLRARLSTEALLGMRYSLINNTVCLL